MRQEASIKDFVRDLLTWKATVMANVRFERPEADLREVERGYDQRILAQLLMKSTGSHQNLLTAHQPKTWSAAMEFLNTAVVPEEPSVMVYRGEPTAEAKPWADDFKKLSIGINKQVAELRGLVEDSLRHRTRPEGKYRNDWKDQRFSGKRENSNRSRDQDRKERYDNRSRGRTEFRNRDDWKKPKKAEVMINKVDNNEEEPEDEMESESGNESPSASEAEEY
jgi:hypothetical protein